MSNPTPNTFHTSNEFSSSTGARDPTTNAIQEMASGGGNLTRPTHHVHTDTEPLPGARGGANTVDYSAEHMGSMAPQDAGPFNASGPHHHDQEHGVGGAKAVAHEATHPYLHSHSQSHPSHPHEQHPHEQHSHEQHPQTDAAHPNHGKKPTIGDKIIGKTTEITGKMTGKHDLQEKGAARAQVGKQ